jgi:hypothetical protein
MPCGACCMAYAACCILHAAWIQYGYIGPHTIWVYTVWIYTVCCTLDPHGCAARFLPPAFRRSCCTERVQSVSPDPYAPPHTATASEITVSTVYVRTAYVSTVCVSTAYVSTVHVGTVYVGTVHGSSEYSVPPAAARSPPYSVVSMVYHLQ